MRILTWWKTRRRAYGPLDALLHAHNRQSMEFHQMSLDLSKLREQQGRLTGAIESLVGVIAAQNQKIADLTAAAAPGTSPEDQAAVDAAAAALAAVADKAEVAAHPPIDPPQAPAT